MRTQLCRKMAGHGSTEHILATNIDTAFLVTSADVNFDPVRLKQIDFVPYYDVRESLLMQKGNTLFLLRNIVPDPSNPSNYAQPQFAGLALKYNELNGTTRFDNGKAVGIIPTAALVHRFGPDGRPRRSMSDLFFLEIRPYDESFREMEKRHKDEEADEEIRWR